MMRYRRNFNTSDFEKFIVIGQLAYSMAPRRRFRLVYDNYFTANSINLWRGRLWGVLKESGRRVLLKNVWN